MNADWISRATVIAHLLNQSMEYGTKGFKICGKCESENGVEMWQRLFQSYSGSSEARSQNLLAKIQEFTFGTTTESLS